MIWLLYNVKMVVEANSKKIKKEIAEEGFNICS